MANKLSRRTFIAASAGAGAALAAGRAWGAPGDRAAAQPNVLVIHTDQQRYDALGACGNPDLKTPHIDALARDGVNYTNSFCPYPVCTPSRYSLLSSRYVHEHGCWNNHCTLEPGTPTFASVLRDAGYRTTAVGKMHFTPTYLDVGFDRMVLAEQNGPGRWDDDYHRMLRAEGLVDRNDLEDQLLQYRNKARDAYWETFGALPSNLPEEYHSTHWTGDRAMDELRDWAGGGNLLMVGFIKPHHPFDPPANWADRYDPDKLTILPGWTAEPPAHDLALSKGYFPHTDLTEKALRRVMAYYYATISQIDEQVGRMVARLKAQGLYDNTLIIVTSDHGEYLGFHHMLLKGNHMYDPLAKVPLIVKYPGSSRAGTATNALINNVDVAPTIIETAGCTVPEAMRGQALLRDTPGRSHVFSESHGGTRVLVRTETHKLLLGPKRGEAFLYDLADDPNELDNRYDNPDYAAVQASLHEHLGQWHTPKRLPNAPLDENAPVIDQPNVRGPGHDHREDIGLYYRDQMEAFNE
ncbi:MAG: sulfatase [Candidatus Hydrogenedentota bacterium]